MMLPGDQPRACAERTSAPQHLSVGTTETRGSELSFRGRHKGETDVMVASPTDMILILPHFLAPLFHSEDISNRGY